MPATTSFSRALSLFKRWLVLVLLSFLGLQVYFLARVAMMRYVDPQSTAFERSQILQVHSSENGFRWRQIGRAHV